MRACGTCSTTTDDTGRFCPACGAAFVEVTAASSAAALVGKTIDGQFAIEAVLGGGAFGTVYRARQIGLDRAIALKIPTSEIAADPVMARRFAREARSAARVQHPGVVAIYAVGELGDGRPYLAMQLVDGESARPRSSPTGRCRWRARSRLRSIASALTETHEADVVHRDLKPSNIMWRRDCNGDDRITLVDFGIAVCKPGNAEVTRLTSGGLIGTPHYMSPEQAHGEQVDARADLYALGCLLFELVTGAPPFDGSGVEVLLAHLGRPAPAPSERNPDVPEAIDRLCARLLAKRPDDRPPTAAAVVALIDDVVAELAGRGARSEHAALRPRRKRPTTATRREIPEGTRPRGSRLAIGVAAAAVALSAAGFTAFQLGDRKSAAAAADEPADTPNGPVEVRGDHRRAIDATSDDGELVMHALVPDPIAAGREIRPHLEIKNKLGQPVMAQELVVTVTDGTAASRKGLLARPHGEGRGHYGLPLRVRAARALHDPRVPSVGRPARSRSASTRAERGYFFFASSSGSCGSLPVASSSEKLTLPREVLALAEDL